MRVLFLTLLVGVATMVTPATAAQASARVETRIGFNLRAAPDYYADQVGFVNERQALRHQCKASGADWHLVYREGSTPATWVTGFAPTGNLLAPVPWNTCTWEAGTIVRDGHPPTLRRGPYIGAVKQGGGARPEGSAVRDICYVYTSEGAWDLVWVPGATDGIGWVPASKLTGFGTTVPC